MKRLFSALIALGFLVCGTLSPPRAQAANPQADSGPVDGIRFPLTPQGRILTSLRRSFPHNRDIPPGPSLDDANKAALGLPFTLAMVSDLNAFPAPSRTQAPLALHGRFPQGLTVAVLSGVDNALCPALTGNALPAENIYGIAFAATALGPVHNSRIIAAR